MDGNVGVPFAAASKITSKNSGRVFTKIRGDGKSGYERMHTGDLPHIAIRPKFKLSREGRFFTIGSCFARNVEAALSEMGVECVSSDCLIPAEYYDAPGPNRNGALNAYTPHSMNELVNLVSRADRENVGLLQLADDEWCDMLVSGLRFLTGNQTREVRNMVLKTYEKLSTSDTVILTLGFTEAWFDLQDGIFVNRSPGGSLKTMKKGDRYTFCNGTPADVVGIVDQTVRDLRRLTEGRAKIILTTSPVPLHATFTDRDVISANLYSKSTLLCAAVSVADQYDFVDYYPSYEMVIYSNPEATWMPDGVHIYPNRVKQVIEAFAGAYF